MTKTISYRLQLIGSARFMVSSLENLTDNLSETIYEIKCTNCNKRCLEYTNFKDGLIEFKCLCCNKSYQKKVS